MTGRSSATLLVGSLVFLVITFFEHLVGAVSAWMLQVGNLFGADTPGLARFGAGFGTVGASVFLVVWPIVGACVCAATAALRATRRARP